MYDAFQVKQSVWLMPLAIDDIFAYRFYDAVVQKHPWQTQGSGRCRPS